MEWVAVLNANHRSTHFSTERQKYARKNCPFKSHDRLKTNCLIKVERIVGKNMNLIDTCLKSKCLFIRCVSFVRCFFERQSGCLKKYCVCFFSVVFRRQWKQNSGWRKKEDGKKTTQLKSSLVANFLSIKSLGSIPPKHLFKPNLKHYACSALCI